MAIRKIRIDSDPILRKKAKKVQAVDILVQQLMDDMLETMYQAKGVGLAAPQVGVSKRVIVCDAGEGPVKLVNPRLVRSEGTELMAEGCLSLPGLCGEVERAAKVQVKALNPKGEPFKLEAEGMLARADAPAMVMLLHGLIEALQCQLMEPFAPDPSPEQIFHCLDFLLDGAAGRNTTD